MVRFIDDHRATYGVEPICAMVPIAPSTYYEHKAREVDTTRLPARAQRDAVLSPEIRRVWDEHFQVYGVKKVWKQLTGRGWRWPGARWRGSWPGSACRGRSGVGRARRLAPTTRRRGRWTWWNGNFSATRPNQLWVADLTYVGTWRGFVYVALVVDAFARRIVGWRAASSLRSDLALGALEQAIYERQEDATGELVHHSDRGVQYVSIKYTERLAEAGIEPSVGSRGDSYDNALAESVIGLFKTEVIRRRGPWRSLEDVEFATLAWVAWFNHSRLLEPIGYVPPAEYEAAYYRRQSTPAQLATLT